MSLTASELCKLFYSQGRNGICGAADRKRNKYLVGMKSGIVIAHINSFKGLNRLNNNMRNKVHIVRNSTKLLKSIKEYSRRRAKQRRGFSCYNLTVFKL